MGKSFFCLWIFLTEGSFLGQQERETFPWLGLTLIVPFPDHLSEDNDFIMAEIQWFTGM